MKDIHITLTEFRNESRVLKEIASLEKLYAFHDITVIALGARGLPSSLRLSEKTKLIRINLRTRSLPKKGPFQVIKFLEFMFKCLQLIKSEKAQVVNLHTLDLLPLGWFLKKASSIKVVYDAHELETEKNGLYGIKQKISRRLERKFIDSCDLVIVVSESIADWYENEYGIERPIVVLNVPPYRELVNRNYFREKLGIRKDQKIFLYQGGLSAGRGVSLLLDAFKQRRDEHIVIVFMGYGELETEIRHLADTYPNIFYFPAVAPDVVLEFTASADIGVSLIENSCLSYYFCMPNKLFEYAMAGLPVVISNMKDMSQFVIQHNMGAIVKDLTPVAINHAIDELLSGDLVKMSGNAYQAAIDNAWEVQETRMLAAYEKMGFSLADSSGTRKQTDFI